MTCARPTLLAAACGLLLIPALIARAQDANSPDVIVTATRLPAEITTAPDAYVITGADIQARQAIFAADLLSTAPGVVATQSGPAGGLTAVSIRGAPSDKTLVLIDGIPVDDPSSPEGAYDFGPLDIGDVSRVEILTGPQGALWGSNAIGGVIAFTTREPNGVSVAAETGSLDTWRLSASVGKSTSAWALGATLSTFQTEGVSAADTRDNYTAFGFPNLHNSEPDGDNALTASVRGRITLSDAFEVDGQIRYNRAVSDIDGFPAPSFLFTDTNDVAVSESFDAYLHARFSGPWDIKNDLTVSDYHLERGDHGDSVGMFGFLADRQNYRWTVSKGSADDPLSVIAGVERENTDATVSSGQRIDLGETSVFALAQWTPVKRLTGVVGVRYDAPDQFQAQTTARVGATLDLGWGFSLQGSFDQGFKTPTISESVCDFCFAPPVPLRPEHAQGYDGGLAWRSPDGRISLKATAFDLDISDEIDFVAGRYININRAHSQGVETEAEADVGGGFRLQATYSYIDAVDADTGVRLLRTPLNSGSFSLFWTRGKIDAAFSLRGEDDDLDSGLDGFTPEIRPGFVVADLAGGYALNDHLRLTARIDNLANSHYEEAFGFGEPGRTFTLGIKAKM